VADTIPQLGSSLLSNNPVLSLAPLDIFLWAKINVNIVLNTLITGTIPKSALCFVSIFSMGNGSST
jgi:hypothetical protein